MKAKKTIYRAPQGDDCNGWMPYTQIAKELNSTKENMCQIANSGLLRIAKELIKRSGGNADPRAIASDEAFQDMVAQSLRVRRAR